ncbi:hypothetical protein [Sphingomonas sp.]|uniref:hypothetical protein n=1 Tax=Sphingomonas sp. TaxID=28214 RepID=UPI0025CDD2FF|nr:hypothetical protein [Sphingomonas sp.]
MGQGDLQWWERRSTVVVLALAAVIPLLWPTIPPLMDLPGHMGRYRVQLDGDGSVLRQFYDFHWALVGNLGVDLLIVPMAWLFGLELGVKLIVMAIPVLTVVGMLSIAREVHGRIPPTALFALPLAYSVPFLFGFVNFALSTALALLAFALWLRLARIGHLMLRAVIFVPISFAIWITHTYGLGLLGVLAFSAELVRHRDRGEGWVDVMVKATVGCLGLAGPFALMLVSGNSAGAGGTGDWFNWSAKLEAVTVVLRDRWPVYDLLSRLFLAGVLLFAVCNARLGFERLLAVGAVVLLVACTALPRVTMGGSFTELRLVPFMLAAAILAIAPTPAATPRFLNIIAVVGLAFFATRIAGNTVSLAIAAQRQEQALAALDHLPVGSRMISFTRHSWGNRLEHLAGMAIVRRRAFSNDQWNATGLNLMSVVKADAPQFVSDPSQTVTATKIDEGNSLIPIDMALARFPRQAFDYVWLIDPPAYDVRLTAGMTPVWRAGNDVLFRIDRK